ncbi:MAG TPA: antitoxin VapB family protein [Candidatus Lokiarchaeia archaeon]|nr:antitoxin VapB family protein [Candidatus Lokiarchaeia archaeon]
MASKTIMIQEDTYNKLAKLKQENESFNDVILRLMQQQQDIKPYFGLFSYIDPDEMDKVFDELEEKMDEADRSRPEAN